MFTKTSAQWCFGPSRFDQRCFAVRCDFNGRICVFGLRSAIAEVYLLKVILFAALSKVCERAAITICAWILAAPKCRARGNPNSCRIVLNHCSTPKRCLGISLLKRFCDGHSGRLCTVFCKILPRCLPFIAVRFALLA